MIYEKIKEEFIEDINETAIYYRHVKTGARVIVIPSKDENKTFCIAFKTAPINSTGLTHILEHSVLCGSKKYPVKEPFVELIKGSLNTFLNAFTSADKTMYPVASLNQKDFKNLMSVYMDAVFYPAIYKNEEIFLQEGWHYELDSKESDLKINGVVYNEMKGAFSNPDDVLSREILHSLFPDNCYGFESGGDPKYIPDLSYEQFKEFHKTFYNPSNAYIVLYGDCDMNERMAWMDKHYLSKFDRIESPSKIVYQKAFDKPVREVIQYPIAQDDNKPNNYQFSYNVVCSTALDQKLKIALNILADVLFNNQGAYVREKLIKENLCEDLYAYLRDDLYQPVFSITASGCKKKDEKRFIEVIENSLNEIIRNKVDKQSVLAILNFQEFKLREANYQSFPKGLIYTMAAFTLLYDDDKPFDALKNLCYFNEIRNEIDNSYFEDIIKTYILDNNHKSYVILEPSKTIAQKEEEELALKLKEYKESLTDKELDLLIKKNQKLKQFQATPDSKENLDKLPKLSLKDIPTKIAKLNIKKEKFDDITLYHSSYLTSDIIYGKFLFDITKTNKKDLPYIKLLLTLLGSISTKNRTYQEIDNYDKMYTGGVDYSISTICTKDDKLKAYANISYSALNINNAKAIEGICDVLFNTLFNDVTRIKECLLEVKGDLESRAIGAGHIIVKQRMESYIDEYAYFNELISGLAYLDFVSDLVKKFEKKKDKLVLKLTEISKNIFNKKNLILDATCEDKDLEIFKKDSKILINQLPLKPLKSSKFKFEPNILNEGIIAPINVNYVGKTAIVYGKENKGHKLLAKHIISLSYLWQEVRVKGGAYGSMSSISTTGLYSFFSYRDPNLSQTLDAYAGIPKFLRNLELSSDELTMLKIGAVGDLQEVMHVSQMGKIALMRKLGNVKHADIQADRKELIEAKLEDIKALADIYDEANKQNIICVVGTNDEIMKNKEKFKNIRNLLNK